MRIKQRQVPFRLKSISDRGAFAGYLSVFGNMDSYRDIVMPGAFSQTLKDWAAQEALPPVLWQHDSAQPLGPYTKMEEDDKGLYVEGQLLVDEIPQAAAAAALLRSKTIRGQSIGYSVKVEQFDSDLNVLKLMQVKLYEGSIVTFPANTEASVTDIKRAIARGDLPSLADFENMLRDVAGFSRSEAKTATSHGFAYLLKQRDAGESEIVTDSSELDSILSLIKNFTPSL